MEDEGQSLDRALRGRCAFSRAEIGGLVASIARALEPHHRAGRAYGDLEPGNVLLDANARVVLRPLPQPDPADDRLGLVRGALPYLAPEQIARGAAGPAADVYALGTIVFELATGRRLFRGNNAVIAARKLKNCLPPIDALEPRLARLVERCLARAPHERCDIQAIVVEMDALEGSYRRTRRRRASTPALYAHRM